MLGGGGGGAGSEVVCRKGKNQLKLYLSVPFHLIELKVCIKVICKVYIN